jgi:hypothetical protein
VNTPSRACSAKFAVIESLQHRLAGRLEPGNRAPTERAPGSRTAVAIERALDYALSPRRSQSQVAFLEHDVMRNARLAVGRSATAEANGLARVAAAIAPQHLSFTGAIHTNGYPRMAEVVPTRPPEVHTSGPAGKLAGTAVAETTTPEDHAVALDLELRLRGAVKKHLGAFASQVLQGMIEDLTVADSAVSLSVSSRTIDRARRNIRSLAFTVLSADEMAA